MLRIHYTRSSRSNPPFALLRVATGELHFECRDLIETNRKRVSSEACEQSETDTLLIVELSAQLRTHLKGYSNLVVAVNSSLKDVNQTQSELDTENKPLPLIRPRLERQLDLVGEQAQEEMKFVFSSLKAVW